MPLGRHADVAGCADLEIQLLVGTDREIFPAVRLILREIAEDDGRLRRVVELVFDVVDFRDLGQFGDVERAFVQDDAVRAIKPGGDDLDLARPALVHDGVDLVLEAARDEHRALITEPKRARVVDAPRIDLDRDPLRRLELVNRELVGRGRDGRRRDRRKPLCGVSIRSPNQRRTGRQRSLLLRGHRRCGHKGCTESAGEHKSAPARQLGHDHPP